MAFCVNCGKEVSDQAVMCPACGHPGPKAARARASYGELASWGARVGAGLVDMLILSIPFLLLFFVAVVPNIDVLRDLEDGGTLTSGERSAIAGILIAILLFLVVWALYKPLFEGHNGQTLGKMAVKIRVIRAEDGERIGYGKAFFRWFMSTLIGSVSPLNLVNYLWPLWDDDNQTLHDKAARTIVVKAS